MSRHVHHLVAHVEERLTREGLREEVGDVVRSGHERHPKFAVLDALTDEIMTPLDVLSLRVVLRIVREVDG